MINKYSADGIFLGSHSVPGGAGYLDVDSSGNVYATANPGAAYTVTRIAPDGTLTTFGDPSPFYGVFALRICPPAAACGPGEAVCGDGCVGLGEQCDDGNAADGDCCSSACQFESSGSPCADADLCNGDETCDGNGECLPGSAPDCDDGNLCTQDSCDPDLGCTNDDVPAAGCRSAEKSLLILEDKEPDAKDKLIWKWIKGQSTTQAEFGVPAGTTSLCLYAGTAAGALIAKATVPAGSGNWQPLADKGYKYTDDAGSADGLQKILLKGSTQSKAKILVKGAGDGLPDPPVPVLTLPVVAQFFSSDTELCWGASYEQADIVKNESGLFKAKAE